MTNKNKLLGLVTTLLVLSLIFSGLTYRSYRQTYDQLETSQANLKEIRLAYLEDVKTRDSQLNKQETEHREDLDHYHKQIDYMVKKNHDLDRRLQEAYEAKAYLSGQENPIDRFFDQAIVFDHGSHTLSLRSNLYTSLWKSEMMYAYSLTENLAHKDLRPVIHDNMKDLIALSESEGDLNAAVEFSSAFDKTYDQLTYGTLSRAARTWKMGTLYKEKTLDLIDILESHKGQYSYLFDEDKVIHETEGLFASRNYLEDYYELYEDKGQHTIDLYDQQGKLVESLRTAGTIEVEGIDVDKVLIRLLEEGIRPTAYIYDLVDQGLSAPLQEVLYYDRDLIVHWIDKDLVITYFNGYQKDQVIKRDWAPSDQMGQDVSLKRVDYGVLRMTYLKGESQVEVIDYLDINQ